MSNVLSLLLVNISEQSTTAILNSFDEEDIEVEHLIVKDKSTISEELQDDNNWDIVILSEKESDGKFPLLTWLTQNTDLPIIFWAAENTNPQVASTVMQKGARDCISNNEFDRLIPVIKRELNHKELKKRFNETLNSQQFLSDIIDITTEEIFIFDTSSLQCFNANSLALKNSGYTREEIPGLTPANLFSEYDSTTFSNLIAPLLDGQREKISVCTNIERKSGSIYPAEIHFKKIVHNGSSYLLVFSKKISGAWHKVQKLNRQRDMTKKYIRKNNQKEQILVNAAHDMRTSLNTIILSNKIIIRKNNGELTEKYDKLTNAIHYSGNHLINYLDEFFDLSGIEKNPEKLNQKTIDLESFGQKLYQTFDPISRTEQNIEFNYEAGNISKTQINTNPTYLKRVLKNLLSNAFKYTNEGSVTLKVYKPTQKELESIRFDAQKAIAFQVKDTGIGISQADQKQIFDRFSRVNTAKSQKSTGKGLGLDISQKLTEALEGKLHIDSKVDSGTTVTLYLPADKASHTHSQNIETEEEISLESSKETFDKTILIVDDNNMQSLAIEEFLKHIFSNCLTAQSKKQAHKILDQYSIDFIILDYIINNSDSLEFAKKIKTQEEHKNIPLIFHTGKKLNEDERQKINQYSNAIIKKGTGSHNKLIRTIYSCLHTGSETK